MLCTDMLTGQKTNMALSVYIRYMSLTVPVISFAPHPLSVFMKSVKQNEFQIELK